MSDAFYLHRAGGLAPLVLFENGTVNPLLGGRHTIYAPNPHGYSIQDKKLHAYQTGTNYEPQRGYFGFSRSVDTEGYDFLHFRVSCDAYAYEQYVGINRNNGSTFTASRALSRKTSHVITIPLASYQGKYYVLFSVWGYGDPSVVAMTTEMDISRIWLDNSASGED